MSHQSPKDSIDRNGAVIYRHHSAEDIFERQISFWLSNESSKRLPLVLFVQGSGCDSVFKRDIDGFVVPKAISLITNSAEGRYHTMVVEKPGVRFLHEPENFADTTECSDEFLKEHTLERWSEALLAALKSVLKFPQIDSSRVLVIGHSEGGISAARLARKCSDVTHIGLIAGGSMTQLYNLARWDIAENLTELEREQAIQANYDKWQEVLNAPTSTSKKLWGHPYLRWSSFLSSSTFTELLHTRAFMYLSYGTADSVQPVEAADIMTAELIAHGRKPRVEKRFGANHLLDMPDEAPWEGFQKVLRNIFEWSLK